MNAKIDLSNQNFVIPDKYLITIITALTINEIHLNERIMELDKLDEWEDYERFRYNNCQADLIEIENILSLIKNAIRDLDKN